MSSPQREVMIPLRAALPFSFRHMQASFFLDVLRPALYN
jgi:hypothetical protein